MGPIEPSGPPMGGAGVGVGVGAGAGTGAGAGAGVAVGMAFAKASTAEAMALSAAVLAESAACWTVLGGGVVPYAVTIACCAAATAWVAAAPACMATARSSLPMAWLLVAMTPAQRR